MQKFQDHYEAALQVTLEQEAEAGGCQRLQPPESAKTIDTFRENSKVKFYAGGLADKYDFWRSITDDVYVHRLILGYYPDGADLSQIVQDVIPRNCISVR